jgi:hypothetical protein
MAQKMLEIRRFKLNTREVGTQTNVNDNEMIIHLTNHKLVKLYYSKAYKEPVLCFSYINCKKFVITRSMWKILRLNLTQIDGILMDN